MKREKEEPVLRRNLRDRLFSLGERRELRKEEVMRIVLGRKIRETA